MRLFTLALSLAALVVLARPATAVVFETQSTATQTISSPLFGGTAVITATGPQTFNIDVGAGTASVVSAFSGTNLPDATSPGNFLNYDLYNTATTGTVVAVPGGYNVNFELLFELKVTSGPFTGLTFETTDNATFFAADIDSLPFPVGTVFSDPSLPDVVNIYVKTDPTGTLPAGSLAGASFGRTVTIDSAVPEPGSIALVAIGLAGGFIAYRRRKAK